MKPNTVRRVQKLFFFFKENIVISQIWWCFVFPEKCMTTYYLYILSLVVVLHIQMDHLKHLKIHREMTSQEAKIPRQALPVHSPALFMLSYCIWLPYSVLIFIPLSIQYRSALEGIHIQLVTAAHTVYAAYRSVFITHLTISHKYLCFSSTYIVWNRLITFVLMHLRGFVDYFWDVSIWRPGNETQQSSIFSGAFKNSSDTSNRFHL